MYVRHAVKKLFTIQKHCMRILFGDKEAYLDKFKTSCRTRPIETQILGTAYHMKEHTKPSGRPGSKFSPGRDRAGTGIEMKTRPGPGLASSRPGPGPGFFQYFSISVKMKQCYMLNKIFQNKLRYVKLKLTVSSSQGRIQGERRGRPPPPPPPREI